MDILNFDLTSRALDRWLAMAAELRLDGNSAGRFRDPYSEINEANADDITRYISGEGEGVQSAVGSLQLTMKLVSDRTLIKGR